MVDSSAQNLLRQDLEEEHLDLGQVDLELTLDLELIPIPQVDLELVCLEFLILTDNYVASLTFGQQNVTPVPVTGSQNPAYQITSEKEPGQTYSTNFHAISMMPAYRNASFEVSQFHTFRLI